MGAATASTARRSPFETISMADLPSQAVGFAAVEPRLVVGSGPVQQTTRRAAGLAALTAPMVMWTLFLTMGLSRSGYNLLTRPFSDLATRGTPNAVAFDLGFFLVPGVLTVVLGVGLWVAVRGGKAWRAGALLVVGAGIFLIATGLFPQDPASDTERMLHGTMSQICFALASVSPLALFAGSRSHIRSSATRQLWLAAGIASFAIEALALALRPVLHYPDGLFQRPFTLALTVWFVTTGAWLLSGRDLKGLSVPT